MIKIYSPLSGPTVDLAKVPDPVFSQELAGKGISIDPIDSVLHSPVAGTVEFLHSAHHALSLKTPEGAEVLIHIGIDTVKLRGEGFTPLVKKGDKVQVGTPLIEFDVDFVATHAKSLLTQVLITNPDNFKFNFFKLKRAEKIKTELFEITGIHQNINKTLDSQVVVGEEFACMNHNGIHARPASILVNELKKFKSQVWLVKSNKKSNAKSVTGLLELEVGYKDRIHFEASGADAHSALEFAQKTFQAGLGEAVSTAKKNAEPESKIETADHDSFKGLVLAPGQVIGEIFQLQNQDYFVDEKTTRSPENELVYFQNSLKVGKGQLNDLIAKMKESFDESPVGIFKAHLEILEDPELLESTIENIQKGRSAAWSWKNSFETTSNKLSELNNELLAARAVDVTDVGHRVLNILVNKEVLSLNVNDQAIVVSEKLTPSQLALLQIQKVKGICLIEGGTNSHVGILARSMGVPAISGLPSPILNIPNRTKAILDTDRKLLKINPDAEEINSISKQISKHNELETLHLESAHIPANTIDNHHVEVFANIGNLSDAHLAIKKGAEGIGLLRSEFLFLNRTEAPTESEQIDIYQKICDVLQTKGSKPVIIRTLDVGGDKPLSYLPMEAEENPFLGIRGLRLSLEKQELFRIQLRALLSVTGPNKKSPVHILIPMVTELSEVIETKKIIQEECDKLKVQPLPLGIMIEVPSAALLAEQLAEHVDYFSIGSNDLTQYTLAVDRGHKSLSHLSDGLHPSVLKLIKLTVDGAKKHGRKVGVCGGIAGDPEAVPFLIGLGVDELSVSVPAIPSIKNLIRNLKLSQCKELAELAISKNSAIEVRNLIKGVTK